MERFPSSRSAMFSSLTRRSLYREFLFNGQCRCVPRRPTGKLVGWSPIWLIRARLFRVLRSVKISWCRASLSFLWSVVTLTGSQMNIMSRCQLFGMIFTFRRLRIWLPVREHRRVSTHHHCLRIDTRVGHAGLSFSNRERRNLQTRDVARKLRLKPHPRIF
ncbi:hypothetical protein BKA83DRAFT_3627186 [Pisolithus microcarpus]|nr:hypothetical protein BKA83DRAFT_3627186 [Pisolithus microcarpus]